MSRCDGNAILILLIATSVMWSTVLSIDTSSTTPSQYVRPDNEALSCLCKFPKHEVSNAAGYMDRLKPLCGNRYSAESHEYTFSVGICAPALISPIPGKAQAGAVQTHKEKDANEDGLSHTIGNFEKAEVMMGSNWIILEYEGGDKFNSHCTHEERRTIIMIMCREGVTKGEMRWVEENSNKSADCYYLFELEHEAACSFAPSTGLSAGSVVCIVKTLVTLRHSTVVEMLAQIKHANNWLIVSSVVIFILLATIRAIRLLFTNDSMDQHMDRRHICNCRIAVTVGVYFIGGFLFLRFFRGAKGLKQIPNYSFWRDFGALQADGCDLICRCGGQQDGSKYYHGIGDHQIECAADGDEVDDHLLPM